MKINAEYLGQRQFRTTVTARTHIHSGPVDRTILTTKVAGINCHYTNGLSLHIEKGLNVHEVYLTRLGHR